MMASMNETNTPPTALALGGQVASASLPASGTNSDWSSKLANIMIVDDEEANILIIRRHLREAGYQHFMTTTDATSVLPMMWDKLPDLVLMDVVMPEFSGLDLLELMRGDETLRRVPVIIVTASADPQTKIEALELGANEFLAKPVDASELILRIRNALLVKEHQDHLRNYSADLENQVRRRTAELEESQREVVYCLARAGESRDEQTGFHVMRVSFYVRIIARELGISAEQADRLLLASQLHDVGKIAIPDRILLKPGKLDPDEWEEMQRHCEYGVRIIETPPEEEEIRQREMGGDFSASRGAVTSPILKLAASIARSHHEKWDGSGYPAGLAGEDIPIEGRITAVADVFDAVTSARPYKAAFSVEKAFQILREGRGQHFDPHVLDAFFARQDEVLRVMRDYADAE